MIVKMRDLIKHAEAKKYAVGYFESFNMDCMLAILDAAEKSGSPVIIGFGGQFLSSQKRKYPENIFNYGRVAYEAAKNASVPAAVLLNETDDEKMAYQGMLAGFNAVMYVKPGEPYADRLRITKEICHAAHLMDIDVEGEFDELPSADMSNGTQTKGKNTDVGETRRFVEETGVDALSIAIGNVHLLEGEYSTLDFRLLQELRSELSVPLVLHGGTGVSDEDMKKAIRMGISKVNVGTATKRTFINAVKEFMDICDMEKTDPHAILGWGGDEDMLSYGREAVTNLICGYMDLFGSKGMAKDFL
jgi:ketose-bisphosphate aldolase